MRFKRWSFLVPAFMAMGCFGTPTDWLHGVISPPNAGVSPGFAPEVDVRVPVGALHQGLLDAYPPGTRFGLEAGKHFLAEPLKPKDRQQFLGFPGAVLTGARPLKSWTASNGHWYIGGQTQRLPEKPPAEGYQYCDGESPLCNKAEDVFYDDAPLTQVQELSMLKPGCFYFDYANSRIYLKDSPAEHTVETTLGTQAFAGGGSGVVIKNVVIEKFGNMAQTGAVSNGESPGWQIESCEIRLNHGIGLFVGHGSTIRANKIHHQGQMGIAGNGAGIRVEENELAYNNTCGYDKGWEAGGSKWVNTTGLVVRKNWSHHNAGHGLWTDINNRGSRYEENVVEDNGSIGILHEISFDAVLRGNLIRRNGQRRLAWDVDGAGIVISSSQGVDAYENILEGNRVGVVLLHSPRGNGWDTRNNQVHDNVIRMERGWSGMVRTDREADDLFMARNNSFEGNTYVVPDPSGSYWEWQSGKRTFAQWQDFGHDVTGEVQAPLNR